MPAETFQIVFLEGGRMQHQVVADISGDPFEPTQGTRQETIQFRNQSWAGAVEMQLGRPRQDPHFQAKAAYFGAVDDQGRRNFHESRLFAEFPFELFLGMVEPCALVDRPGESRSPGEYMEARKLSRLAGNGSGPTKRRRLAHDS